MLKTPPKPFTPKAKSKASRVVSKTFGLLGLVALVPLNGCAAPYDATKGYTGSTSVIRDSHFPARNSSAINFFIVTKINGHAVENSVEATAQRSFGLGNVQIPVTRSHPLPVTPLMITIQGVTRYGAPIMSLINKIYDVSGVVRFVPQAGEEYEVRGVLGEAGTSVWIENSKGEIVQGTMVGYVDVQKTGEAFPASLLDAKAAAVRGK